MIEFTETEKMVLNCGNIYIKNIYFYIKVCLCFSCSNKKDFFENANILSNYYIGFKTAFCEMSLKEIINYFNKVFGFKEKNLKFPDPYIRNETDELFNILFDKNIEYNFYNSKYIFFDSLNKNKEIINKIVSKYELYMNKPELFTDKYLC